MEIRRGDKGSAVHQAQRLLNKTGALLEEDGVFGRGCVAAVANTCRHMGIESSEAYTDEIHRWLLEQPDPLPGVSTEAVAFIAREEVGSHEKYNTSGSAPCFPGGESGITIGIGYDLRAQAQRFAADWESVLDGADFAALQGVLGKLGTTAMAASLRSVLIPWDAAWYVFTQRTLPQFLTQVQHAFPGQENLSPLSRGALLSLVYNRGASLTGDRRREMQAIHDAIAAGHFEQVKPQFLSMRRLWPTVAGLCRRREKEGELFDRGLSSTD